MSLFSDSEIKNISYYGPEGPGKEGTVVSSLFTLNGQEYMCIDRAMKHTFTFTPAITLFVHCESEEEI